MTYTPGRNDIVWLDFEPTKGKEIGKYRPALIMSSKAYSTASGLIICCPISTSIRNTPTEVKIANLDRLCVVTSNLVQTLDTVIGKLNLLRKPKTVCLKMYWLGLSPSLQGMNIYQGLNSK
jgi:mRNA interferase MazF